MKPQYENPPATMFEIENLRRITGGRIPNDFIAFLTRHNGGEWSIGIWSIQIWSVEELIRNNAPDHHFAISYPSSFIFATNRGPDYFAFNTSEEPWSVVSLFSESADPEYIDPVSKTFTGFLSALEQGWEIADPPIDE